MNLVNHLHVLVTKVMKMNQEVADKINREFVRLDSMFTYIVPCVVQDGQVLLHHHAVRHLLGRSYGFADRRFFLDSEPYYSVDACLCGAIREAAPLVPQFQTVVTYLTGSVNS